MLEAPSTGFATLVYLSVQPPEGRVYCKADGQSQPFFCDAQGQDQIRGDWNKLKQEDLPKHLKTCSTVMVTEHWNRLPVLLKTHPETLLGTQLMVGLLGQGLGAR